MPYRVSLIACLALACATPAQLRTFVNPAPNATVEGSTRIQVPFGFKSAWRFQQMVGLNGLPATMPLQQIAFRRDNDPAPSPDYVAWNPTITLTLSTSPRTPMTMSPTFADNIGNDARLLFNGTLNWPAQVKKPPGPTPFAYTVPFANPFSYSFVGDLLVDIAQSSSDNPNLLCYMDADLSPIGTGIVLQGPGCPTGSNAVVVYDSWGPGATARITLTKATTTTPSILSLGASGSRWGALPLPLDLAPIGAPGCRIYNDNVFWLNGATSLGEWDVQFRIPDDPALGGIKVYAQFYQPGDANASNAARLSTSDGHEITLATPMKGVPPQSVAHTSVLTAPVASSLQLGYGAIVQFAHR